MRQKKQIQTFSGRGKLTSGQHEYAVAYNTRVFQEFVDGIAGMMSTEVALSFDDPDAALNLMVGAGDRMVLMMEGGMKLDGYLADSNGTFTGTGPIYSGNYRHQ